MSPVAVDDKRAPSEQYSTMQVPRALSKGDVVLTRRVDVLS